MNIFEPRTWTVWEIGSLKWSCILFGDILGAYFSEFVMTYVWLFVIGFVLLAIKPVMKYLGGVHPHRGEPRSLTGSTP